MKTLDEILEGLQQSIPKEAIHPPDSAAGIFGEYVTAQWAMQEANNIFGVDGIRDIDVLDEKMIEIPLPGETFGNYVFITTVRVTFVCEDEDGAAIVFSRPGRGVGTAQCPYNRDTREPVPVKPQQLDTASKAALSDSIKNALMRTGQRLGGELYFDERTAQTLGWEVETDRVTRQRESSSPSGGDDLESLGAVVCKYGIGKADDEGNKPYKGWTIQQMWDDEKARGVFTWAVENEASGWFNERLRKFAALMGEEPGEPEGDKRMITIWTGKSVPADDKPKWAKLVTNEGFKKLLAEAFNPDGKIKGFGPNHVRMVNHYKAHFGVKDGAGLTWEMLNALVLRCKEGEEAVSFGYPEWYGKKEEEVEDEPEEEVDEGPTFVLGRGKKTQKVPVSLQILVKNAGIEDPKKWLWGTLLNKQPVGEWTQGHTALVAQVLDTIANTEGIEYDSPVIGQMWSFAADGISE